MKSKVDFEQEILAYLNEHPDAQDTVEGIVEWWLLERDIKRQTLEVREALRRLVGEGFIVERAGRDGRSHYRINSARRGEIEVLLKEDRRS